MIEKDQCRTKLNQLLGASILELNKILMYKFHCNCIKNKDCDKALLKVLLKKTKFDELFCFLNYFWVEELGNVWISNWNTKTLGVLSIYENSFWIFESMQNVKKKHTETLIQKSQNYEN